MTEMRSMVGIHIDLEKTFGAMSEAVVITQTDRKIIFVNRAAEQIFGYTREELIGNTSRHLYERLEDYEAIGEYNSNIAQTREGRKYAVNFKRRNKNLVTCEVLSTPLFDPKVGLAGFLFIARDISDRIALENKAEQASAILEDAIESISEGFALYDKDDHLVICNENYKKIYPESAAMMQPGSSFRDILAHGLANRQYDTGSLSEAEWLEDRMSRHREADGAVIEQKLGDGTWLRISEKKTRSNGTAGIRSDITELKTAQNELIEAYANITILTDSLSCAISEVDLEGNCRFANEIAAKFLNSTVDDLIGTNYRKSLSAELQTQLEAPYGRAMEGERSKVEVEGIFPDGLRRNMQIEYIPKPDVSGRTNGLIIFATDITNRKKIERTLAELYSVTSTRKLGIDAKIQQILRIGCEHFDLPFGIISRIVDNTYSINWVQSPNGELEAGASFPLGDTYCSHTIEADQPIAIAHTAKSELALHPCYRAFALEAYIGVPLLVDGERYGTINFTSADVRQRPFTKTDKEIIRQFADWVGNEIARQQDHDELMEAKVRLERIASVDDLTSILNRRAFLERANTEVARFRRTQETFSAVLIDIDHFKSINDTYGHSVGDEVLKRFTAVVGKLLRAVDVFGRVGGEEFCVLLDRTGPADALMVAERIRETVTTDCKLPGVADGVTCSMGIATISNDDVEFSTLLQRADVALYQAKNNGRNSCCAYQDDMIREAGSNVAFSSSD
ncbi:diguanylate cyclase [Roseibium polysiphoniae]|nr:diguanylate cyclase [Roseibium polysiphoniae]